MAEADGGRPPAPPRLPAAPGEGPGPAVLGRAAGDGRPAGPPPTARAPRRPAGARCVPTPPRAKVLWAAQTAASTLAISAWCLRPETHWLLPTPSFGAYVTIFLTGRTLGSTLRLSADSLAGAAAAVSLSLLLAELVHASSPALTAVFLFGQSLFWAYLELPMATRRLALSTMVITCLGALRRPRDDAFRDAAGLVMLVALSAALALLAALVPAGPQLAAARARAARGSVARAVRLLVEKSVAAFLESGSQRRHVASVQLGELGRAASCGMAGLAACLDEAQWEPRAPWCTRGGSLLWQDMRSLERAVSLLDTMQRALATLPFNSCHRAFAARLERPLTSLAAAACRLLPPEEEAAPPDATGDAERDLRASLAELHAVYGRARRELLYPPGSESQDRAAVGLRQSVNWRMEDLLHMNTFLFTAMHLAGEVLSDHRSRRCQAASSPCWPAWRAHCASLLRALTPRVARLDRGRLGAALRFAVAIELAALFCLVPALNSRFELEIWGPVEVTFLMFRHAGGSLRQSILRLEGAALGSVVGYLCVVLFFEGSRAGLLASLTLWSFVAALFRGSPSHGYAAVVAAWTAVIVVDVGIYRAQEDPLLPQPGAATAALERMTHTVIGVACVVFGVNIVRPEWSRDAAREQVVAVLGLVEQMYASVQAAWLRQSEQMALREDEAQESTGFLGGPPGGGGGGGAPCSEDELEKLGADIKARISALQALVAEAAVEPAFWRQAYPARAGDEVVRNLMRMVSWLQMLHAYTFDLVSQELKLVFSNQGPRRWLSQEWVRSLRAASLEIAKVIEGLRGSLPRPGGGEASLERCYLGAMRVEGLENGLRKELGQFLHNYDRILCGTISDSQLRIMAGTQKEAFLTNLDMLLYNSSVFAMRGFVEQVLSCSRAIRDFIVADSGAGDAAGAAGVWAAAAGFSEVAEAAGPKEPEAPEPALGSPPGSPETGGQQKKSALRSVHRQDPPQQDSDATAPYAVTVIGPARPGVVEDLARAVDGSGGSVVALRLVGLDGDELAVFATLALQASCAGEAVAGLREGLRGFEISLRAATSGGAAERPPHEAEVHCVCPAGAPPALAEHLAAALSDAGLSLLDLRVESLPTSGCGDLLAQARVGAPAPIDEAALREHLLRPLRGGPGSPRQAVQLRVRT